MVYDIKIKQKERLLDYLYITQEDAFINGLGFIKNICDIVLVCNKKLEQKHIERVVEIKNICYKSHDELYIDNQYCYFIYPVQKRRKKKCS